MIPIFEEPGRGKDYSLLITS